MSILSRRKWVDSKGKKRPVFTKLKTVKTWQLVGKGKINYTPYLVFTLGIILAISMSLIAITVHLADTRTPVVDNDQDFIPANPDNYNDCDGLFWCFGIDISRLRGGWSHRNESIDNNDNDNYYTSEEVATLEVIYRRYPEISAIDYIVFGILGSMMPTAIYGRYVAVRKDRIERKFPDFLRDLAEFWKGGLSMTVAVETLAKGEYGYLNEEVNKMATQITWGVSFGEVLEMFTERVDSQIVRQSISMVDEANKAGGRISDILLAASYDAKEIKSLQMERELNVGSYVMVIYTSFLVYLIIIIILVFTFIPAIAESGAETAAKGQGTIGNVQITRLDPIWIATVFFFSVVIQAVGNGMAAGFMKTGQIYGGLWQASLLLTVSWLTFEVLGIQTSLDYM